MSKEIINSLETDNWYPNDKLNSLLNVYMGGSYEIYHAVHNQENLLDRLNLVTTCYRKQNIEKKPSIIPLNTNTLKGDFSVNNHWTGLHIRPDFSIAGALNKLHIKYVDPMGRAMNSNLKTLITNTFKKHNNNTNIEIEETLLGTPLQYTKQISPIELTGDTDNCGPILVYALNCIATNKIMIQSNNLAESIRLGAYLRNSFDQELSFNTIHETITNNDIESLQQEHVIEENNNLNINKHVMEEESFNKIKLTEEILQPVVSFKAITTRGKQKPILDKDAHQELVQSKYDVAKGMDDHITLFRVEDKKTLARKETKEHTVPGPLWTPPSSVGFVLGALSEGNRVWAATEPTIDSKGLLQDNGDPAIYARELEATISSGWLPRDPHAEETYGRTNRGPVTVFTPPTSPRFMPLQIQKLMDAGVKWPGMPRPVESLRLLSEPLSSVLLNNLKTLKLNGTDFNGEVLKLIRQPAILELINNKNLCLSHISKTPAEVSVKLFRNNKIVKLLSDSKLKFEALKEAPTELTVELLEDNKVTELLLENKLNFEQLEDIYYTHIEDAEGFTPKLHFNDLYELTEYYPNELDLISSQLDLDIMQIIYYYNKDETIISTLADANTLDFLENYGAEIDIDETIKIYKNNPSLFDDMVKDEENLVADMGLTEFIEQYEELQIEDHDSEDEGYIEDPYGILKTRNTQENCPEGFSDNSERSSEEEEQDDNYYGADINYTDSEISGSDSEDELWS